MPKSGSDAFQYMTPTQVDGYREYMRRHREGLPQDAQTRAGNTAYGQSMKRVRAQRNVLNGAVRGTDLTT